MAPDSRSAIEACGVGSPIRWEVLEACPVADQALWLRHAEGFAASFVAPSKRERWRELLNRRPRRIGEHSHKLHADLDRRTCRLVSQLPPAVRGDGLFYAFADVPRVTPATRVVLAAGSGDAIYSLAPGVLAVYFFHEGEMWLCQATTQVETGAAPEGRL